MLQLNPPIPVKTPRGNGIAHFIIDYSLEFDLHWVVFMDGSGECWTFANREIRVQENITVGRPRISGFGGENEKRTTPMPSRTAN